jgi:hypothetical protein
MKAGKKQSTKNEEGYKIYCISLCPLYQHVSVFVWATESICVETGAIQTLCGLLQQNGRAEY